MLPSSLRFQLKSAWLILSTSKKKKKKMRKHRVNPVTRQWQARDRGAIRLKKRRVQRQYL